MVNALTFEEFTPLFMDSRLSRVSRTTHVNDRSLLKVHLLPHFGKMALVDIRPKTVEDWWISQPRTRVRETAYRLLQVMMKTACRWEYVAANPCQVEITRKERVSPEREYRSYDDFKAVMAFIPDRYRLMFQVAFGAHLRLGELVALDWDDYDPKADSISVSKQITHLGDLTETKTGENKVVTLIGPAKDGLAAHYRRETRNQALSGLPGMNTRGRSPKAGNAMFLGARGGRIDRGRLDQVWRDASVKAGFGPNFHLHDIRAVGLTLLTEAQVPTITVMKRGGHRSYEAALKYQRPSMTADQAAASMADKLLA